MASSPENVTADKNAERRKRVFLGQLPTDFLRISETSQQQQEAADQQTALALQQQFSGMQYAPRNAGRLSITVAQANLVKNYGLTRMDPYVRLRVGHSVYETHTAASGGKNPHWNKVVQCLLPQGVTTIHVEIFDECSFTLDELVAWAHITIPPAVMNGETIDDWFPLSGKQGDDKEGLLNLVLSYSNVPLPNVHPYGMYATVPPVVMVPNAARSPGFLESMAYTHTPVPVFTAPPVQGPPPPLQLSEQDLKQIQEMFPNMDKEVIKSVFEANRGNKDGTVNSLLQMNE